MKWRIIDPDHPRKTLAILEGDAITNLKITGPGKKLVESKIQLMLNQGVAVKFSDRPYTVSVRVDQLRPGDFDLLWDGFTQHGLYAKILE